MAVLDANVLYPARLRDLLIRLAIAGHYHARWSEQILDECFSNLIKDRPDLPVVHLQRTRTLMAVALPDADVAGDAAALETIFLPDPDDRHVVATAIAASASLIVTSNLSDFPVGPLTRYGLEAVSPDEFVHRLILDDVDAVAEVIEQQAASLRNPPMTTDELLDGLEVVGLTRTVNALRIAMI